MAEMPEQDELVLATVKKIMPYGAFCTLDEYGNREAFVHISEVAPRWIKNIHEFLHEGQHVVAKIYQIVAEKNQVDLSLKRVSDSERKMKLESVKKEKRAQKLFEVALKQAKSTGTEAAAARVKLEGKYGDLISAFEEMSQNGEKAIEGLGIEKGLVKALLEICTKNIKKASAQLRGVLSLVSYSEEGIEEIKAILAHLKAPEGVQAQISYLGAPRYQITVVAPDFKVAQKAIETLVEQADSAAKGKSTSVSFEMGEKE
ncbi:translation initiation factor IF-2 subunit alpha [Candidatus Micrarchaeota archaeon]|nr:translation initiation factor IF-2 subunit alpha [Candidatus Micrarchaeota archaeon]